MSNIFFARRTSQSKVGNTNNAYKNVLLIKKILTYKYLKKQAVSL
jgi:hypothetical protein